MLCDRFRLEEMGAVAAGIVIDGINAVLEKWFDTILDVRVNLLVSLCCLLCYLLLSICRRW